MSQQAMYSGMVNSPQTELTTAINDIQTTIELFDGSVLPDAPNICTILGGELSETIKYETKVGNILSDVTRGFRGQARNWSQGQKVARNWSSYDWDSVRENVEDHEGRIENNSNQINILSEQVDTIETNLTDASTTEKGIVQLSNATDSDSETLAATSKAVKTHAEQTLEHVNFIVAKGVSDTPSSYPKGVSFFTVSTGNTGFPTSNGFVQTIVSASVGRATQLFYEHIGTRIFFRHKVSTGDEWQAWKQLLSDGDFATDAETLAGTSTTKAVTPANVEAKIRDYGNVTQIDSSITLTLAHRNKVLRMVGSSDQTITIPNDSTVQFPNGTQITIIQAWSGSVSFAPASGATLYSKDTKRTIDGLHASATLVKVAPGAWNLIGALK